MRYGVQPRTRRRSEIRTRTSFILRAAPAVQVDRECCRKTCHTPLWLALAVLELLLVEDLLSHIRPEFLECLTLQAGEDTPPTAFQCTVSCGDAVGTPSIRQEVVTGNTCKASVSRIPATIAVGSEERRQNYMLHSRTKTSRCGTKIARVLTPEGT